MSIITLELWNYKGLKPKPKWYSEIILLQYLKYALLRFNNYICTICVCVLVAQSCLTFLQPHRLQPHQAPLSMGFSTGHWSGLPFPSPKGTIERKKVKSLSPNNEFLKYFEISLFQMYHDFRWMTTLKTKIVNYIFPNCKDPQPKTSVKRYRHHTLDLVGLLKKKRIGDRGRSIIVPILNYCHYSILSSNVQQINFTYVILYIIPFWIRVLLHSQIL